MLETDLIDTIQQRIDQKTKPLGALGKLEPLALQLALIQSQGKSQPVDQIQINRPCILVFAGDHGIADEGISIAPSAVTHQMVLNFLAGGAGINCFCRVNQVALKVIDTGILIPIAHESDQLVVQRLGERTRNFAHEPAMSMKQVETGLELGRNVVTEMIEQGSNLVMFGEMGIGNTSSAAAIMASLTHVDVADCVGFGTGISEAQYQKKIALVTQGVVRARGQSPKTVLSEVGGYEIVQMVGAFLAATERQVPILVDGFIASVAALVAIRLAPAARELMIFAHQSQESGHQRLLAVLGAKPLLDLGLRLGEGTGAVLAVSLVRAAAEFYNSMASFTEAGVEVEC
ncbi:nicotinate-nucleotide--dimethylbenzimidazole phosphoribosyltransferase [Vibrio sp. PP-XX7]